MGFRGVVIVAVLIFALGWLPESSGQIPASNVPAPRELVVTSAHPVGYTTGAGPQVQYDVYLNFTRAQGDPGNWNYDVCRTFERGGGNCANNFTPTGIPNRVGWASIRDTGSVDLNIRGALWQFNVSANLSISGVIASGQATANVPIGLRGLGESNQTGNVTLAAPQIVSVRVMGVPSTTAEGSTELIFVHSTSDTNNSTTGDFRYLIFEQFVQPAQQPQCNFKEFLLNTCLPGGPSTLTSLVAYSESGTGNAGFRYWNISYAGAAPFYLALDVTPIDNATGLYGTTSCQTVIDPTVPSEFQRCGIYLSDNPLVNPGVPAQGPPVFPGLSVSAVAASTGISAQNVGYALAAFLVFGLAILGFRAGGGVAAGIVGFLGIGLAFTFNLLPAWLIIVIVALSAAIVVFRFKGAP